MEYLKLELNFRATLPGNHFTMRQIFFHFFIANCLFASQAFAQTEGKEANLKAAFIYNFTEYVDWQDSDPDPQFVIGILGPSPVSNSLKQIAAAKTVKNKRMVIKTFSTPAEIDNCNILFISKNSTFPLQDVLKKVSPHVLTISEEDGYAQQGTVFNFLIKDNKLKFEANLKALAHADLKASSQLLKLAIIVD